MFLLAGKLTLTECHLDDNFLTISQHGKGDRLAFSHLFELSFKSIFRGNFLVIDLDNDVPDFELGFLKFRCSQSVEIPHIPLW